jgi:hypothetical protein
MDLREEFVSELCGRPVFVVTDGKARKLGKLEDLSIGGSDEAFPAVARLYVRCSDGALRYAPFSAVASIGPRDVTLRTAPIDFAPAVLP